MPMQGSGKDTEDTTEGGLQDASPLEMIGFLHLQPLVNIKENCIIGYEVLSSLKAGVLPECWFSSLKPKDAIAVLEFQLKYTSSLLMRERLFFSLSIGGLLAVNEKDIKCITGYSPLSIEISDTYNMKNLNADDHEKFLRTIELLRDGGVCVWLDNFTLDELIYIDFYRNHIDGIKIDRRELREPWLRKEISIIQNILVGIDIIIEGVDTEADLAVAKDTGIKIAQGLLWDIDTLILDADILI